ncbi:chemotaxis protein CheW [Clostridium massiliamazoniense]|uniref:chemotaxis protein CheW n=1 Tax=Clostridium massiliamazoniense TaxID=1347366 RepID=UPI0006D7D6E2|nr:chemotaxis protein CheW [Clostridium massiliamazoniense]
MDYEKILIFNIAGSEFAISIKEIHRILNQCRITLIPEKEYFVEGIIDYSDTVLNVVNLAKLFSIEERDEEELTLIIVTKEDKKVALKTNGISKIIDLNLENKKSIPQLAFKEGNFFSGVVNFEGRLVILLDVEKILSIA